MTSIASKRAVELHEQGMKLSDAGDDDAAIQVYTQALALDPERATTLYNLGLIYKYRRAWIESFAFNAQARKCNPSDAATSWNLAIAATALRDWNTAREVWRSLGIFTEPGEGPIELDRGSTPVRLNDDATGAAVEVVWAQRICPVRARILNIPTGNTNFRFGDIVLHDGAPVGYRLNADGNERPVFNVLELFEASSFSTYEATLRTSSADDIEALTALCNDQSFEIEDWTSSMRTLCRACSEGRPHDQHDHDLPQNSQWQSQRRVGFAATEAPRLDALLSEWLQRPGCAVVDIECSLEAPEASSMPRVNSH